jgi:predicted Zn-dependent protease
MSAYKDSDLRDIRKVLGSSVFKPVLNIVYLSKYSEVPTSVGVVINRDTIYLFKDTLLELTNDNDLRQILEKTTLMHEWGHLLGLEHNNISSCIMDGRVDVYDKFPLGEKIPTNYCPEELQELKLIKTN